ncbi:septal ring lytic transglycosylase RlpA family protein [bacterium]|nr:septal ring lytic transglycosylase RlpA family protein [bacterium]
MLLFAQSQTGKASYYSDKLHGNETASGEKYDKFAYTAAHITLPFGTKVKVTNLWNGKWVVVKINDRGPFDKQRIIDVSKQAAIDLQMITAGVVDVKIEVVNDEETGAGETVTTDAEEHENNSETVEDHKEETTEVRGDGTFKIQVETINSLLGYGVQVGAFADYLALIKKIESLQAAGFPDVYVNTDVVNEKRVFRIVVGNFERREEADLFLLSLKSKGFEGFVVSHQVKKN